MFTLRICVYSLIDRFSIGGHANSSFETNSKWAVLCLSGLTYLSANYNSEELLFDINLQKSDIHRARLYSDILNQVESAGDIESEDDKLDMPTPKSQINQSSVAEIIELYSSVREDSVRLNSQLMQLEDMLENVFNVKIKPDQKGICWQKR